MKFPTVRHLEAQLRAIYATVGRELEFLLETKKSLEIAFEIIGSSPCGSPQKGDETASSDSVVSRASAKGNPGGRSTRTRTRGPGSKSAARAEIKKQPLDPAPSQIILRKNRIH